MRGEVEALISAVLEEADAIDDLVEVVRDQREAVKVGDAEEMDGLMKEMHEVVFDVQTQELRRSDRAKRLAAQIPARSPWLCPWRRPSAPCSTARRTG